LLNNDDRQSGHHEDSESPTGNTTNDSILIDLARLLRENTALITIALFSFVAARVLTVAKFDLPTAVAVFATVGIPTVVVNTLVGAVGWVSALAIALILSLDRRRLSDRMWYGAITTLALVAILLASVAQLFAGVFVIAVTSLYRFLLRRRFPSITMDETDATLHNDSKSILVGAAIPIGIALLFATLSGPVWLPAERLTLKDPEGNSHIGYVLNEGGDWFSILTTEDRKVIRIRSDNIGNRMICNPQAKRLLDLSLPQLLFTSGREPPC
jgi:hypothetical protein